MFQKWQQQGTRKSKPRYEKVVQKSQPNLGAWIGSLFFRRREERTIPQRYRRYLQAQVTTHIRAT